MQHKKNLVLTLVKQNQNFKKCIKKITKDDQREISLNGNVYDFSVDHSLIKREDILNIHHGLLYNTARYVA